MEKEGWEHFPHQADMGVRGFGQSKAEAFEQAAAAMTAVITDLEKVTPAEEVRIACEASDDELLLPEWLNCLLYEMSMRKMLFSRFKVQIEENSLQARVWGEKIDIVKHRPAVEVKGATYTALKVYQNQEGVWTAQCIVDV